MSAHRWAIPAVLLALAAPAPASAAKAPKVSYRLFQVTAIAGTERIDFAGDPAAGCAARGVCGISGTQTYAPDKPRALEAMAVLIGAGAERVGFVQLGGGTTTASVTTAGADATCTDTIEVPSASATLTPSGAGWHARLHGGVAAADSPGPADEVFATHCAGPRTSDLIAAKALAQATVTKQSLAAKTVKLDLAADKAFASGGFAGHVVTDLRLTLKRQKTPKGLSGSSTDVLPTPVRKR